MMGSRVLAWPLLLAWAFTPSALGGVLALGVATHAHAHAFSLRADVDHFDLVFSHVAPGGRDLETSDHDHTRPEAPAHGDHVVHLSSDELSRDPGRRTGRLDAPPALSILPAHGPAPAPARMVPARARTASGPDLLRIFVLRL
jgi:hypothetical protein